MAQKRPNQGSEVSRKRAKTAVVSAPASRTGLRQYQLAFVVNNAHKKQVEEEIRIRKIPADTPGYEDVRRNKKFLKLQALKGHLSLKEVVATKKPLDALNLKFYGKGIYRKSVIDVLKNPALYVFTKVPNEGDLWSVSAKEGGKELLTTDFSQEDLVGLKPDLEKDVGVLKAAVEHLVHHPTADLFPLTSHPGHHADAQHVANYCVINNAVVCAAMIKEQKPRKKIGILDLDAHPGDGTKHLIAQNKHLIERYVSLHSAEEFVNMETFADRKSAVVLRGPKIPWKTYDAKLEKTLSALHGAKLDVLIVCIGFDTLKEDPTGGKSIGFQLLPVHFRKIGARLARQGAQVVFVQEGGYDCNLTAEAFQHLVEGFHLGRQMHAVEQI